MADGAGADGPILVGNKRNERRGETGCAVAFTVVGAIVAAAMVGYAGTEVIGAAVVVVLMGVCFTLGLLYTKSAQKLTLDPTAGAYVIVEGNAFTSQTYRGTYAEIDGVGVYCVSSSRSGSDCYRWGVAIFWKEMWRDSSHHFVIKADFNSESEARARAEKLASEFGLPAIDRVCSLTLGKQRY